MINKELTLQWQRGLSTFNRFVEEERKKRLSKLTVEESYKQYLALCTIWERMQKQQENINVLDRVKIDFLVHRLHICDKLASKKNEHSY